MRDVADEAPTVLIVDDESSIVDLYGAQLDEEFDVRRAYSGREGIEQMDESVDVALIDRRMPTLSGDEVLDRIREEGYDCKVAMVTAVEPDVDIIEMPFDAYLVKPVEEDELRGTTRRLVAESADGVENAVLDALGDVKTRRCCYALVEQPRSAQELAEATGFSLTTVYRRLNALKQAGLVVAEQAIDPDGDHYQRFRPVAERIEIDVDEGFTVELDSGDGPA